jgi:Kdo2-lipid IVA lauroyltransferase/acyltransferase
VGRDPIARRLRHAAEYAALRLLVLEVDLLPLGAATWLASRWADLAFALDGGRRRVAVDNLLRAGMAGDAAAARRLARRSARHFAAVVVETLKAERLLRGDGWSRRVELRIPDSVWPLLRDPARGLIVASGHFGNWELGAQALSRLKSVVAAARRVSNPHVDRLLQRRKPAAGFRLVPEWFGAPTRYTEALARGEALALLIDLDARGEGLKVDFFGRSAATHVTVAMLHLVTKAPLVFATCRRLGGGRFELALSEPIERRPSGDKLADVRSLLERLNGELEAAIRAAPEQYLWAHSRWKYGEWEPPPGFVPVSGRLGPVERVDRAGSQSP